MTVTALCETGDCQKEAEAAQDYCARCLNLWPRLMKPIDIPLSEE